MEDDDDIMGAAGVLFAGERWIPNAILGILISVCSSGNGHCEAAQRLPQVVTLYLR